MLVSAFKMAGEICIVTNCTQGAVKAMYRYSNNGKDVKGSIVKIAEDGDTVKFIGDDSHEMWRSIKSFDVMRDEVQHKLPEWWVK